MRTLSLLPAAMVSLLTLLVGLSAFLPFLKSDLAQAGREARPGDESGLSLHRELGHGYRVALWLALPSCALVPLILSWGHLRRRGLAVVFMGTAILGVVFFSLLESFTGFLMWKRDWMQEERARESLRRMKALHVLGFPVLLLLVLVCVWAISVRLARRRPPPPGSGPEASPETG